MGATLLGAGSDNKTTVTCSPPNYQHPESARADANLVGNQLNHLPRIYGVKSLSVNNVDSCRKVSEGDDGGREHVERDIRAVQFFVAHQQFAKAIEPRVRDFHHPAPGALALLALGAFLAARAYLRRVLLQAQLVQRGFTDESGVRTQVLRYARRHRRSRDHDGVERRGQLADVMASRAGHDE